MVHRTICIAIVVVGLICTSAPAQLQPLKVSGNGHYLVKADGTPFFWLGDTAWGLFGHTTPEDAKFYLADRQAKGFTVIQAVVVLWDSTSPRLAPERQPLINRDPTQPNETFFAQADAIIDQAQADGMYVAIVPLWFKTFVTQTNMLLTPDTAEVFGKYLGTRWRDKPVIWILGGDRPAGNPQGGAPEADLLKICRGLAAGIKEGDRGSHLITYHPTGGRDGESSSWWLEDEWWLDFNGLQTGHFIQNHNYRIIAHDFALPTAKPVIDLESGYENITDRLMPATRPDVKRISAWDVRRYAYLGVFAGAAGYTYGNGEVYSFSTTTRPTARWGSGMTWKESIKLPASGQMQFLKNLIESRPMLPRIPEQSMLIGEAGETTQRIEVTRADDGSYAFVYSAAGRPIDVKCDQLSGRKITAWWYDPRTGEAKIIGEFSRPASREFVPPTNGEGNDWVLVLDQSDKNFAPPGVKE